MTGLWRAGWRRRIRGRETVHRFLAQKRVDAGFAVEIEQLARGLSAIIIAS